MQKSLWRRIGLSGYCGLMRGIVCCIVLAAANFRSFRLLVYVLPQIPFISYADIQMRIYYASSTSLLTKYILIIQCTTIGMNNHIARTRQLILLMVKIEVLFFPMISYSNASIIVKIPIWLKKIISE